MRAHLPDLAVAVAEDLMAIADKSVASIFGQPLQRERDCRQRLASHGLDGVSCELRNPAYRVHVPTPSIRRWLVAPGTVPHCSTCTPMG